MFFDPMYFVFMIPGLLFMLWAQNRVRGSFKTYSQVPNAVNMTGAQVARRILAANGLQDVVVESTKGDLTDHYDPRDRTLRLSQQVYGTPSIAAMGIAAELCIFTNDRFTIDTVSAVEDAPDAENGEPNAGAPRAEE